MDSVRTETFRLCDIKRRLFPNKRFIITDVYIQNWQLIFEGIPFRRSSPYGTLSLIQEKNNKLIEVPVEAKDINNKLRAHYEGTKRNKNEEIQLLKEKIEQLHVEYKNIIENLRNEYEEKIRKLNEKLV